MKSEAKHEVTLAIHHRPGSFSDRWIEYCELNGIRYVRVNLYKNDVIAKLQQFDAVLWQPHHTNPIDAMIGRHVIRAAEHLGIAVFPNSETYWSFDDKIGQKYLLESIGAPLVPAHVFFDRDEAILWAEQTTYPKVFKLRRGAGARNVMLIESQSQARQLIAKAFANGFRAMGGRMRDTLVKLKSRATRSQLGLLGKLRRFPKTWRNIRLAERYLGRDIGYVYFQDFVPGNTHDTRVTIVGDRAFAFRRAVRCGDFRASGSGVMDASGAKIDVRCIEIAFSVTDRLNAQSIALDFVHDDDGSPKIVECSFAFVSKIVHDTNGSWDRDLTWHQGARWPEDLILETILSDVELRRCPAPLRASAAK